MDTADEADLQLSLKSLLDQSAAPTQAPALEDLGQALLKAGQNEAALAAFEAVIDRGGEDASLWQIVTGLRLQLKLPHLALDAAFRAVALAPDMADAWYNLGLLQGEVGDDRQALEAYEHALAIEPTHYGSMRNLPLLLARIEREQDARAANERLLQAYPDDPWLHFNSGDLLIGMRAGAQAEAAFRHALTLAPDFHRARYGLSIALAQQGRVKEAKTERRLALQHEPDLLSDYKSPLLIDEENPDEEATPERVAVVAALEELRAADWHRYTEIIDLFTGLVKGEQGLPLLDTPVMAHSGLVLSLGDVVQHQLAKQAADRARKSIANQRILRPKRKPDRQLHIAYLSSDFRPHPTAYLMGRLYARHDRSRFKVHAYSLGPVLDSAERRNVIEDSDIFRDLGRLPAVAAAQLIANDGIDILVDLTGYTRYARPEILALRPAPLQIAYLGYMGTLGADFVDYTFLDREVLPIGIREYWDERIAYLPNCSYHCELPVDLPTPPSRAELGLSASGLVLCALHHPRKLEPVTWACWMDLLKEIPDATLWLLHETREQRERLLYNAAQHGVGAERLVFSSQVAHAEHLSRLACADFFLDTFVFNGHTTTVDALGAGVPVVTLSGETVVARVAGSMLKAHGLPELVAQSVPEYKALVHRLASDRVWRESIIARARAHANSRLFRPESRVREIEAAYESMWARHQAGLPPEDFDVPEFRPG